jgi:CrcB protein
VRAQRDERLPDARLCECVRVRRVHPHRGVSFRPQGFFIASRVVRHRAAKDTSELPGCTQSFCARGTSASFSLVTVLFVALGGALGFLSQVLANRAFAGVPLALVLGTGVLGGFTTYSSFNLETLRMLQQGQIGRAMFYASLTFVTCLALGAFGLLAGARLMR